MVEIKDVSSGYGKHEVLHGISFTAEKGKITTVIGSNGCGKSTLLKTIVGLLPLTGGCISIDGISADQLTRAETAKRIAYLPQNKNIPDISVGRLVLHGRFPYLSYPRKYRRTDVEIAEHAMEQMEISDLAEKQMYELSGGMRQKAYIAMALAQQAPVIIMDEPTAYLDIGRQIKFAEMIKTLAEGGKTIILVLHDILFAVKISDSIVCLRDGTAAKCGTPDEILHADMIQKLYGIHVKRIKTDNGIQYYYEI